jgi:glycosyltransferase involved in cell wall biosynthesis
VVIGDGPARDDVEDEVRRLGLDDVVELRGAQPPAAVAAALRDADVFCLPTFAEGLPVSLMEAMAVGVPVVTTFISGIPELVVDGDTGWVVPAGSVDQLAAALRDALCGDDRDARIDAARARVERQHDRRRTTVDLERLLRDCHAGRGG